MLLLKRYYIFFLCINIFLPKLNLGFASFYIFEVINLLIFALILLRGKILIDGIVISYLIFMLILHMSFFLGYAYFEFFDAVSFARLIKFTFFVFYIIAPYLILNKLTEADIAKVVKAQFIFFLCAGAYVFFHMITEPKTIHDLLWDYTNKNRLIGLTGYGINLSGKIERLPGSTSVAMGVYIAFIFLIFLSKYHFFKRKRDLLIVFVLVGLELIVYSRSGLLVMAAGLLYYFYLNARLATFLKFAGVALLLVVAVQYFNLKDKITEAGSLNKVVTMSIEDDPRYRMLQAAYQHIVENPEVLLLGGGFGEEYLYETVGYTQLEGLLPTTLISSGIFAVLALCGHFFIVWHYSRSEYLRTQNEFSVYLYAIRLFVPGWSLTALTTGNTFQTDFYFPVIYFILIASYYLSKETRLKETQIVDYDSKEHRVL